MLLLIGPRRDSSTTRTPLASGTCFCGDASNGFNEEAQPKIRAAILALIQRAQDGNILAAYQANYFRGLMLEVTGQLDNAIIAYRSAAENTEDVRQNTVGPGC